MPFPPGIRRAYANEAHFRRAFLHRLLQGLGYAVVLDYHGAEEFGKDLVFGEVDRFGHVRYHALQARFLASIGLKGVPDLIECCHQAFANPFVHPATGQQETISSFYAVNAGSISDRARRNFFAALVPRYHRNVFLLDGQSLLRLDRWAGTARFDVLYDRLIGLINELELNHRILYPLLGHVEGLLAEPFSAPPPVERFFTAAVALYSAHPFIPDHPTLTQDYLLAATRANHCLDALAVATVPTHCRYLAEQAHEQLERLPDLSRGIEQRTDRFLQALSALAIPDRDVLMKPQTQAHEDGQAGEDGPRKTRKGAKEDATAEERG